MSMAVCLATGSSPPTSPGYEALRPWMRGYGNLASIGVESTGSFGAALARELTRQGEHVIEVNRPNRIARRMDGKSDRLDAEQIARAVLGKPPPPYRKANQERSRSFEPSGSPARAP